MADRYIDIFEVSEYGDFFLQEVSRLRGLSALVDIDVLQKLIQTAKEKVEAERSKAGIVKKSSSTEVVTTASESLRGHINRFYSFLNSLDPDEIKVDVEKFFPGNVLAGLQQLKPADVKARAEKVSSAFGLDAYKSLEVLVSWRKKLEDGGKALGSALSSQHEGRNDSILLTASVATAREEFLAVYNGVAKPLVRGLLSSLSRGDEYVRFFRDLQVNEDKRAAKHQIEAPATPPKENS